jgi:hypothetical protein
MSSASAAMERKPQPPTKTAVADFIQGPGPGPDPTLQMSTLEMLASWYSGEDLDAGEVRSLWLRTVAALVGLWVLSHFAPS